MIILIFLTECLSDATHDQSNIKYKNLYIERFSTWEPKIARNSELHVRTILFYGLYLLNYCSGRKFYRSLVMYNFTNYNFNSEKSVNFCARSKNLYCHILIL